MRRFLLAGVVLVAFASSASGQSLGGGSLGGGSLGAGALGAGAIGGGRGSGAALTLPADPEYHLAAWIDFAAGATNAEEIGATQSICPSADSDTTACLGQSFPSRRGNWATAANCGGPLDCWQFAASDRASGQAGTSPADWDWLGEEPFVVHVGMNLNAVSTTYSEVFANRNTTATNVPGVLIFLDHRLGGRDVVVRVGGAVTQTELDGNDCMLGVDETEPFIVTVKVTAASGADSIELFVNGSVCDTGVINGYSPTQTAVAAVPGTAGALVSSESYFVWADSETSAGSVAAMESRGDQALAYYAAQLGVTLP